MIDVLSVICQELIDNNIAGGNVLQADSVIDCDLPAVFVSDSFLDGNENENIWTATITISCSTRNDTDSRELAKSISRILDGWGSSEIMDVQHVSTIPIRSDTVKPTIFTRASTYTVIYQE